MKNFKASLIWILTGIGIFIVSAFLTLAIDQAFSLTRLYRASAASSPVTDFNTLRGLSFGFDLLILVIIVAILFFLVWGRPRRLLPASIIVGLIFVALNLYSGRHILPQLLIWPGPNTLAEQYTQALAANDLESAWRLTDGSEVCQTRMGQIFQAHQDQFQQSLVNDQPEMSIKTVSVKSTTTFYEKPVPQRFSLVQPVPSQFVTFMAEMENGKTVWLNLKMRYTPFWGTRYICGQAMDD